VAGLGRTGGRGNGQHRDQGKNSSGQGTGNGRGENPPNQPGQQQPNRTKGQQNGTSTAGNGQGTPGGAKPGSVKIQPYSLTLKGTLQDNRQVSLSPVERTAIGKLVDGQVLTSDDRLTLSNLIASDRPGLSTDEVNALSLGLVDDLTRNRPAGTTTVTRSTSEAAATSQPPGAVRQDRRFLRLRNTSPELVKVWVLYHFPDDQGGSWVPAKAEDAVLSTVKPGQTVEVFDHGARIAADRIRYWAVSSSKTWSRNASSDLVLALPGDDKDGHYADSKVQVYTLTLAP
jgi:hypothetical protein